MQNLNTRKLFCFTITCNDDKNVHVHEYKSNAEFIKRRELVDKIFQFIFLYYCVKGNSHSDRGVCKSRVGLSDTEFGIFKRNNNSVKWRFREQTAGWSVDRPIKTLRAIPRQAPL